ncbi:MAG: response regulator, partial [Gemmatimonadota bacterium]
MSPNPHERKPTRSVRVLVVEDAMDQALLIRTFLGTEEHWDVSHVQDGDRAIELLDERPFDLLITDLNLPGTSGFDVLRHVRSHHEGLPVLAVTGYTGPQYAEEAYRAGAADVVQKPLAKDELLARIHRLLPEAVFGAPSAGTVLAVGARPGDVELGCGGALARHAGAGQDVVIVVLDRRLEAGGPDAAAAAQRSAEHLGARMVLAEAALGPSADEARLQLFVNRLATDLGPAVAYVPAPGDAAPDRAATGRLARAALAGTPLVLGYVTGTSRDDLVPEQFTDVAEHMASKAESVAYYQSIGIRRRDLTAD